MHGFQAIPELVRCAGISHVFGMVGGTNVPWIAHGVQAGAFGFVRTRHEETAVNGAAGYARSTGSVGVCTVTRGPGFANAVGGLIAARESRTPLLLVVGESPATLDETAQNIHQRELAAAMGVGFHHASGPGDLEATFWQAMRAARRAGYPQVLSVADAVGEGDVALSGQPPASLRPQDEPDQEAVMAAVDALARARRPLLLAGQGAVLAGCRADLEELAGLAGARVATSLRANRFFSGHPHDLGLCGSWSPPIVREQLAETDVVLAVGASLNEHTTDRRSVFRGATIIHNEIDAERPCMASAPELTLLGDARRTARALIAEWRRRGLGSRPVEGTSPSRREITQSLLKVELGHDPARGVDLRQVLSLVDESLPPDRIVVTDWGRSLGGALPSLVDARDAESWVLGRAYGVIGLGLGLALGAAAAHPDRRVVLFSGDGGFMLSAQDLDAVRLAGLDLTVIILNDEQYGSEVKYLSKHGLPLDVISQSLPDIPLLAQAFGGTGVVVRSEDDLAGLDPARPGLSLVDVRIDPLLDVRGVFG